MNSPTELTALHFHDLAAHFLALSAIDRYLRFGWAISDAHIVAHVEILVRKPDDVFLVVESEHDVAGVVRLEFGGDFADLGLSVSSWARARGIGGALLKRAALHAGVRGVTTLFVRNLSANPALQRVALRLGMQVASAPEMRSLRIEMPRRESVPGVHDSCAAKLTLADDSLRHHWNAWRPSLMRAPAAAGAAVH